MPFLQRINYRPNLDTVGEREKQALTRDFDPASTDVIILGDAIQWSIIEEVEVAIAARSRGAAGWLVKNLVMSGERYHVAFYFGREEKVLPNLTHAAAEYIVKTTAYYAPKQVRYTGPEGFAPTVEF